MSRLLMYTCKCDFKSLMNSIFKINNNLTAIIIHYDHVLHLIWKESYFGFFFILLMKTALNFVYTYNVVLFNWSSFSLHWLFLQLKERNMPIFEIYFVAISLCFKVQVILYHNVKFIWIPHEPHVIGSKFGRITLT